MAALGFFCPADVATGGADDDDDEDDGVGAVGCDVTGAFVAETAGVFSLVFNAA
jgi:hypothetical protein